MIRTFLPYILLINVITITYVMKHVFRCRESEESVKVFMVLAKQFLNFSLTI